MAVVELRRMGRLLRALEEEHLAVKLERMSKLIHEAIQKHGIVERNGERVYAYEVDGYGNSLFMDDANVPSLISLPYVGYVASNDPVYLRTRKMLLSERWNPYFYRGKMGVYSGVGSPHTPHRYVWPMGLALRILTSNSEKECKNLLEELTSSTQGTYEMHESFSVDDTQRYTRAWFAWADGLFGQAVMDLVDRYPEWMLKSEKKSNESEKGAS